MTSPSALSTNSRERALNSLASLPPFSPILNRLLATLASEDVSIAAVADIIEKDTVIAGNTLKIVNSAMYGRGSVVTSIRHAASMLGIDRLRNAVLGMSVTRMWNQVRTAPGWSTARFNLHSVATALAADLLAQRVPVEFPEGAFLAGLFHDVGKLLIAVGLRDEFVEIGQLYAEGRRTWSDCEFEVLGFTHADLSADAIAHWRLAAPVRDATLYHHAPGRQIADVPLGTHQLSGIVHCANLFVNSLGISVELNRTAEESSEDPFRSIGLADRVPELIQEFHAEYESLSNFFH